MNKVLKNLRKRLESFDFTATRLDDYFCEIFRPMANTYLTGDEVNQLEETEQMGEAYDIVIEAYLKSQGYIRKDRISNA